MWHKYNADILKIQYIWRKNLDNTLKKGVNLLHNIMKKITIAIDGFSSCGKSTMAKDLAKEIGYIYIDSGAMYRAVTLYSIENGIFHGDTIDTDELKRRIGDIHILFSGIDPETGRPNTYLNGVNVENKIRTMEVSSKVRPDQCTRFCPGSDGGSATGNGKSQGYCYGWS